MLTLQSPSGVVTSFGVKIPVSITVLTGLWNCHLVTKGKSE